MKKILLILLILIIPNFAYSKPDMQYIHKKSGIHIYKININKLGSKIKPYVADDLMTVQEVFDKGNYRLVVNGGFFDMTSGNEISFVKIDKKMVNSPFKNEKLISDLTKQERLTGVINRAELKIFALPLDRYSMSIENHFKPNSNDEYLTHSLQAGPLLAPYYKPDIEGFVRYDKDSNVIFDSVNLAKRKERTILGLKGKYLYIVVFTGEAKKSGYELRKFVKRNRYKQAMALDGGGSTTLITDDVCVKARNNMRKVKSFLVIER